MKYLKKILFLILTFSVIAYLWYSDNYAAGQLEYQVPVLKKIAFFETNYLYIYLHIFTLVPIFFLSFDSRVSFYKKWKTLIPAIIIAGIIFIIWDVIFTKMGVWGFNNDYLIGINFLNLPIEEWLFFFSVPFACLFIYECLNHYIKADLFKNIERPITIILIVASLSMTILTWDKLYPATTFFLTASLLIYHLLFIKEKYRSRFYLAYLVSWIPFMLVDGVLTGAYTKAPIVLYNPAEFLNIRITAIPLEDSVYSFLLLLLITTLYESYLKSK